MGWVSDFVSVDGREWLFFVAMASSYVLGLTLLAATGTLFKPVASKGTVVAEPIEFPALATGRRRAGGRGRRASAGGTGPSASEDAGVIRDRTSKQCLLLQERFGLSVREAGGHGAHRAGQQHGHHSGLPGHQREHRANARSKHIYTKLNIHKRQELLDMLHDLEG